MAKVFSIGGSTISYGGFLLRELGEGSLTISKTVSGSGFDPTKTFELTVVFSAPVTYNGTTSTTHVFNLAHGQSVTITGIPELTEYEVTETPLSQADLAAGYSIVGITGYTGIVENSGVHTASAENYHSLLPAKHIRIQFDNPDYDPTTKSWKSTVTWTRVSTTPNVWDCENTDSVWRPANFGTYWGGPMGPYHVLSMNAEGVTDTKFLFHDPSIKSIEDVCRTESITNMSYMFSLASDLTSVPLFDTSGATDMTYMFESCYALTSIPQFDTSNVTDMSWMFKGCTALTTIPLLDTSSVTEMNGMFWECRSLTSVPLFDTSSVTDMEQMFYYCVDLTTIPLFDTGNVTDMSSMCEGCSSLTAIPLFDTGSVQNVGSAFEDCTKVRSGALALYTRMSNQPNPPPHYLFCFEDCGKDTPSGRAELAQIPGSWGGTGEDIV